MHSIAWWPNLIVLLLASGIDLRTRRIPNWLVVPFLASGWLAQAVSHGFSGAWHSLAGTAMAGLLFGVPCFLRAMGMGDLKLAAGVGAWIGPGQLVTAFIVTGIVGGILAAGYTIWHGSLGTSLDKTGDLMADLVHFRVLPHAQTARDTALSIPYAPAIAIGTLFSFFAQ